MQAKPNLVVVDIDGTVNRLGNSAPLEADNGLIQRLTQLNRRDDTEVVWRSWWPRDLIERLNEQLDLDFRILPLETRADESYGTRDGVRLDPWELEDALRMWAEHLLAVEFRRLSGKPGEIQVSVPRWGGNGDDE